MRARAVARCALDVDFDGSELSNAHAGRPPGGHAHDPNEAQGKAVARLLPSEQPATERLVVSNPQGPGTGANP